MTNPKDEASKNKTPLHLVPLSFMRGVAEALATGAAKYGAWNWRMNHITASTYISACERHLRAWQEGQELDEESKLHPLKHAAATLAVLIDAIEHKSWIDDRPTVRNRVGETDVEFHIDPGAEGGDGTHFYKMGPHGMTSGGITDCDVPLTESYGGMSPTMGIDVTVAPDPNESTVGVCDHKNCVYTKPDGYGSYTAHARMPSCPPVYRDTKFDHFVPGTPTKDAHARTPSGYLVYRDPAFDHFVPGTPTRDVPGELNAREKHMQEKRLQEIRETEPDFREKHCSSMCCVNTAKDSLGYGVWHRRLKSCPAA